MFAKAFLGFLKLIFKLNILNYFWERKILWQLWVKRKVSLGITKPKQDYVIEVKF